MKEKISSFLKWKPSEKLIALGALAVLAVMLLPLLRLCFYSVPWYDDYAYAGYVTTGYSDAPVTLWDAIRGAWSAVVDEWIHWEGTYTAIFMGALVPIIWGEEWYFLGPMFLILFLTISVMVLVRTFLHNVLRSDAWTNLALQAGCSVMVVMFIYSAQRGFYWYDGGVFYVGMSSFLMLLLAALIKLMTAEKKTSVIKWAIISAVLSIVVAGANYVTTLQGLLWVCSFLALAIWQKRKSFVRFIPVTVIYAAAFCVNVLAPGTQNREVAHTGYGMSAPEAVVQSFLEAARRFPQFTRWITLAVMILLIPLMWQVVKRTEFKFRYPGLLLLWSVCMYASGFAPGMYALGAVKLDRMLCAIKITLQILLLLNEIYFLGWFCQKRREKEKAECVGKACWWFYPVMAVIMLFIFTTESDQAGNYSAYGAYYYIHTGEAYNFYQEYLARLEVLKSDEPNVVLEPYNWRPWFLHAGDLSENPEAEQNHAVAWYYGKESIICREKEAQQ